MEMQPLHLSPLLLEGYYIEEISVLAMPHLLEKAGLELFGNFHPSAEKFDKLTPLPFVADVDTSYNKNNLNRRRIRLTIESENDESPNFPYKFRIVLVGYFQVDESVPADRVQILAEVNGPSLLYSVAREVLASATGRGPFPAILLPSVSFIPTKMKPETRQLTSKPKKAKTTKRSTKGTKRAIKK